jgi:predicted membrane channel-forming protein YqfA (hemolysin III family)
MTSLKTEIKASIEETVSHIIAAFTALVTGIVVMNLDKITTPAEYAVIAAIYLGIAMIVFGLPTN